MNYTNEIRLDRFLREKTGLNQAMISRMIRKKDVKVNNKKAEIGLRLLPNDEIFVPDYLELRSIQQKECAFLSEEAILKFKSFVIFENEDFFAINKPAGLAVQGGSGIKYSVDTYINAINPEYRIVHRLDKETSGALLIAKNRESATKICNLFASDSGIYKEYIAVVSPPVFDDEGQIYTDIVKVGKNMLAHDGNSAKTKYFVIQRFGDFAKLKIVISTGKTHQIRVHMNHIGSPIVGDVKYGGTQNDKMLLHSHKISLLDYEIIAPVPCYFDL